MADTPLPDPESELLAAIVGGGSLRLVYGLLHRRRGNPPTAPEIRYFLQSAAATDCSAELAVRGLRDYFEIAEIRHGGLLQAAPWPVSIRSAIKAEERQRKVSRRADG